MALTSHLLTAAAFDSMAEMSCCVPQGIAVLTVQHQMRDIETLIAELTPSFHVEVARLKRKT